MKQGLRCYHSMLRSDFMAERSPYSSVVLSDPQRFHELADPKIFLLGFIPSDNIS